MAGGQLTTLQQITVQQHLNALHPRIGKRGLVLDERNVALVQPGATVQVDVELAAEHAHVKGVRARYLLSLHVRANAINELPTLPVDGLPTLPQPLPELPDLPALA